MNWVLLTLWHPTASPLQLISSPKGDGTPRRGSQLPACHLPPPPAPATAMRKPFTAALAQTLGAFHRVAICVQTFTH